MKKLNCVGLPDEKSSGLILNVMNSLSKRTGSKKALQFRPHFSIRNDFLIDNKVITSLEEDMQDYIRKVPRMKLHITGYGFYPWKIIYLDIEKTAELQSLHSNIMEIVQKYRDPWISEILLNSPHFSGNQKEYIHKYGYQFAFEYYSPHFTVCGNDMSKDDFTLLKAELTKSPVDEVFIEKIAFMGGEASNSTLIGFNLQ